MLRVVRRVLVYVQLIGGKTAERRKDQVRSKKPRHFFGGEFSDEAPKESEGHCCKRD